MTIWSKLPKIRTSWIYTTWLTFLLRYRQTFLGPLWILVTPIIFIVTIGVLFANVGDHDLAVFIPYLAAGWIFWSLISGFVSSSTRAFPSRRGQILQAGVPAIEPILINVFTNFIAFAHQLIILVAVFIFFQVQLTPYALVSVIGLVVIVINGIWLTTVFGIVGARYRDLGEVISSLMRIAFLATPIIWMPGSGERGGILGVYLMFNPFYHFLEIVRAPLLNQPVHLTTWIIVSAITVLGCGLAYYFYRRFAKLIPLWI